MAVLTCDCSADIRKNLDISAAYILMCWPDPNNCPNNCHVLARPESLIKTGGSALGRFFDLFEHLVRGFSQRVGQLFGQKILGLSEMCAVGGAQAILFLALSQAFVHLGKTEGVVRFQLDPMLVGTRLPFVAGFALPGSDVIDEFAGLGRSDRGADHFVQIVFAQQQCDLIALEEQLGEAGAVFAGKTSFPNGLNLTDAVVGMMDAIALIYGNKSSPGDVAQTIEKTRDESIVYKSYGYKSSFPRKRAFLGAQEHASCCFPETITGKESRAGNDVTLGFCSNRYNVKAAKCGAIGMT